jgi:zinc transport system ATP-binding protein
VTLEVAAGERLGILGPNGGGKTTLVKLALGLLEPHKGSVRVFGESPQRAARNGTVGYVPQRCEAELSFPVSVRQVVSMGAWRGLSPLARVPKERRDLVAESIDLVGAGSFADKQIGKVSGGQLQRTLIARALACGPRILIMDEPTVGIDPSGQLRFAEVIERVRTRFDLTVVIVSHDVRAIAAGCDRVACLATTLHSHTSPEGLTPEVLAEVFQHDVASVFGDVHVHAHPAESCEDPSHLASGHQDHKGSDQRGPKGDRSASEEAR